jgi:translation initiation factor 6 (eIF-6)
MSEYKENEDLFNETTEEDTESEEVDFTPSSPDLGENYIDGDIVTAVLLIKNKQGAVLPVTNLDSLKMERQANAHEVLRMCADVQDQISAIRVVGELAQIFQHLNQSSLKAVAEMLKVKVNGGGDGEA